MTQPAAGTWRRPFAFYAPLTTLTYLVDAQLFGVESGAVPPRECASSTCSTHSCSLRSSRGMTAKPWRSAWVAGLFALHPLHVESVAWISERKDVLSTFFWMLTMLAYIRYTRRPGARTLCPAAGRVRRRAALQADGRDAAVCAAAARCLAARAALPSRDCPAAASGGEAAPLAACAALDHSTMTPGGKTPTARCSRVISAAVVCLFIQLTQPARGMGASWRTGSPRRWCRMSTYLGKMFWPTRLAASYPFLPLPAWQVVAAAAVLLGITVLVCGVAAATPISWSGGSGTWESWCRPLVWCRTRAKMRADRYTYVPSIGIFIMRRVGRPRSAGAVAVPAGRDAPPPASRHSPRARADGASAARLAR